MAAPLYVAESGLMKQIYDQQSSNRRVHRLSILGKLTRDLSVELEMLAGRELI